jgi:hypothetical protein
MSRRDLQVNVSALHFNFKYNSSSHVIHKVRSWIENFIFCCANMFLQNNSQQPYPVLPKLKTVLVIIIFKG